MFKPMRRRTIFHICVKLLKLDPSFACFEKPEEENKSVCESAVAILPSSTKSVMCIQINHKTTILLRQRGRFVCVQTEF